MKTFVEQVRIDERREYYSLSPCEVLTEKQAEKVKDEILSFLEIYYESKPSLYVMGSLARAEEVIEVHVAVTKWEGLLLYSRDKETLQEIQPAIENILNSHLA